MHKKPLPPSYIPTYTPIPGTAEETSVPSPSEQLSSYLARSVQFIQKSPFEEDVRRVFAPPKTPAAGKDWLEPGEVEYGVVETGYADGYPVLLANEGKFPRVTGERVLTLRRIIRRRAILTHGYPRPSLGLEIRQPRTDIRQGTVDREKTRCPAVPRKRDCRPWVWSRRVERVGRRKVATRRVLGEEGG